MTDSTSPISVGTVVDGKYEVERVLGSGGMGVVVAARHLQLGKIVALKFLLKHALESREAVSRFMREGQALARITSPNVARVMDVGTLESGEPYLVMEYLEGSDLGALVKRGQKLPIAEAVGYLLQVCEAIAEAHAKGIVHRDLKPSNLFLTQAADGTPLVKVLDFGISKSLIQHPAGPAAHDTSTGALVGSPMYMSPEQIRDARRVDARTDIWALGVILHELLAGKPPFHAETLAGTLASVAADPPAPLRAARPEVPVGLESTVRRCLQKAPQRRFASVAELARALEEFGPPDAHASVERIVRLLGPTTPSITPIAEAPRDGEEQAVSATLPSWEGETVPAVTSPPLFPRRVRYALAGAILLGAVTGLFLFREGKHAELEKAALPASPSHAAESFAPSPTTAALPVATDAADSTRKQTPPPLSSASALPVATAKPLATTRRLQEKSRNVQKPPPTPSQIEPDDGTADRK